MTQVDQNILRGNYAESVASSWLSRQCLVRPVASGTDIGIDLYCESLIGTSPFKHFWVQVKAIPEVNIEDGEAWFDFEVKHLRYWARQPVPVYAFLVPVLSWPPQFPDQIFGVRITDLIVQNDIPDQVTVRYRTSEGFSLAEIDQDLSGFIQNIVPHDTASLLLLKGIIAPIDEPVYTINHSFPKDVVLQHIDKVFQTIRFASEICLAELIETESSVLEHVKIRRVVDGVLRLFLDDLSILGLSSVANSAYKDGDTVTAKEYLSIARSRLEDTDFDETKKAQTLTNIEAMIEKIDSETTVET